MLLSQARTVLSELRSDIRRRGYDQSEKRHLAVLFNDLKYLYSNTRDEKKFDPKKFEQVAALEKKWQEDRRNALGGADSIHAILAQLEQYLPDLPPEVKSMYLADWYKLQALYKLVNQRHCLKKA